MPNSPRRGSVAPFGAVAELTRSVSRFAFGKKKKKSGDRYMLDDDGVPMQGPGASQSGVTVMMNGILTPRSEGATARLSDPDSDEEGLSRRSSLMEWLKDVLPPGMARRTSQVSGRLSRLSRGASWSSGRNTSPGSAGNRKSRRAASKKNLGAAETMSAAEMMSEAHREEMLKKQREALASGEGAQRKGGLRRLSSAFVSLRRMSSFVGGPRSPRENAKKYPAAPKGLGGDSAAADKNGAGDIHGGSGPQTLNGAL